MNLNLTEIIFILDRSGSMAGLEADTIGGYNQFLKAQAKKAGELRVTTVLFDHEYACLYQSVCPKTPYSQTDSILSGAVQPSMTLLDRQ